MKKSIVLALTILISISGFSQDLDLGLKIGANFANVSDLKDSSSKTGFHAGAFVGAKLSDKIGIQGDLLYSQQGSKIKGSEFELTYVNVPVVLKYYLVQGLNVQLGPQFGFIVDDKIKTVIGTIEAEAKAESFDLSGVAGLGLDLPFGLRIDGRYNFGLSEVIKGEDGKNTVVSVSVGYSFL
ncbi:porin family protein [Ulvibacter antarcticus]|uniref:Outer membrane protein with beta-barrel domain n=1 Tax=Ulvibacter antarcticus TaxID=442714 RepID=A0A3L9YTT7_9FLAO|nr:porin family protein [Ulvibacter antarcticus]RMA64161.1 outer membrane protein with beta-barrel domain [Ulvibacter antarcticus]